MTFFINLSLSIFVSSLLTFIPWHLYKQTRKKSLIPTYIQLSIQDIPEEKPIIVYKKIDVSNLKLKTKPFILINNVDNLNDSYKKENSNQIEPDKVLISNKINNIENQFVNEQQSLIKLVNKLENNEEEENENKIQYKSIKINETVNNAFAYNPKIKAQKEMYQSSKEGIKQVKSNFFPSIDINASKGFTKEDSKTTTVSSNDSRSPQDVSINLTQNLYRGGKISAEIKKAKNKYLMEEENLKLVQQEVILEAAKVFLEVLQQQKLIELNSIKEKRFKNDLESIEILFKLGEASRSDLIFAKSQLVKVSAAKTTSINDLEAIEAKYKNVVGNIVTNTQLMEPRLEKLNLPENYLVAEEIALKNNPKYRKLLIEEKISRNEVRSQIADALPSLSLDAEYRTADDFSSKGSSSDSTEIMAELTIPLFRGGKNLSKIKQAKLIAKKVRYDLENRKNETIQEVKNAWSKYKSSEVNLKSANISYEANKLILEGIEQEAELGLRSYIDVLKSKEELIDAEFEKIKANNQHTLSALELKANIGELSLKDLDI